MVHKGTSLLPSYFPQALPRATQPSRLPYCIIDSPRNNTQCSHDRRPSHGVQDGYITRWAIIFTIIGLFIAYLVGGYYHASYRVRKGLLPRGYHRWMIKPAVLAQIDPRYGPARPPHAPYYAPPHGYTYRPADHYGMGSMPPPPVYDPNAPRPPAYVPPEGGSKVNPVQDGGPGSSSQEFAPPPGPPPQGPERQQEGGAAESPGNNNDNPFRG